MNILIKLGTITNAQRSQRILLNKGYRSQLRRLENPSEEDGCGYAIVVRTDSEKPVKILEKSGIKIKGVEHI